LSSTSPRRRLGAGLTDEAAARRLGTSLRTYRRRVAELMAALEAGSRFQAGVRAGELGLAH
jgi:DNA-binding NarL/FixJ family response regulator